MALLFLLADLFAAAWLGQRALESSRLESSDDSRANDSKVQQADPPGVSEVWPYWVILSEPPCGFDDSRANDSKVHADPPGVSKV